MSAKPWSGHFSVFIVGHPASPSNTNRQMAMRGFGVYPHQDFGLATINDWDVIIWVASIIRNEINETGDPPG